MINKYKVNLDENGYLTGFYVDKNGEYEFDASLLELDFLNAYKIVDGQPWLDEEKKAKENNLIEISRLKIYLLETSDTANDFVEELLSLDNPVTFITDIIALIKTYKNTYKTILAQRKQARDRIKELEK